MNWEPAVKWSGSKRSQADKIIKYYPKIIDTYYEPFLGGASMLYRLMKEPSIRVNQYVCSDKNEDLINLWKLIKSNPKEIYEYYKVLWNELNKDDDIERKKEYFNMVRDRYNKSHDPKDFMFIMRTVTNGMPRYNSRGEFNNTFHVTRNGISPIKLLDIMSDWSYNLNRKNVIFNCCSYDTITPKNGDFCYFDPPYANTKGMYFGSIDNEHLFQFLRNLDCNWVMSFDGKSDDNSVNLTFPVPKDIYKEHVYLESGNSSFRRILGTNTDCNIQESLYIK